MARQRTCTRCSVGTETCAIGDFYVCNVCDALELAVGATVNEYDSAAAELEFADDPPTVEIPPLPQAAPPTPPPIGSWLLASGNGIRVQNCRACGCMGAVAANGVVYCPAAYCTSYTPAAAVAVNKQLITVTAGVDKMSRYRFRRTS